MSAQTDHDPRKGKSSAATTVAALYVERDGIYWNVPGVDPWDEERDARLYEGPHPVVAHPPCNKWSPLAYINASRLKGYEVGDDGGCFDAALSCVFAFGGVVEHPAESIAWKRYGLPRPQRDYWQATLGGDFVTEVDQGAYGHRARKRTWLLYNGPAPPDLAYSFRNVASSTSRTLMVDMRPSLVGRKPAASGGGDSGQREVEAE